MDPFCSCSCYNHFFIIKNDCSCSYYKKDYVASSCHSVILHLVHFTLCIRFVSSQTLQSLNKFILKNINYITKYIYYETIFHNESNNIDLALGILIVLSISLVKVEIFWFRTKLMYKLKLTGGSSWRWLGGAYSLRPTVYRCVLRMLGVLTVLHSCRV